MVKIPFKKTFTDNSDVLLRRAGYAKQYDKKLDKYSYYRRLGSQHFPKFHVYVTSENPLEFDLHLDHKPHTYAGQRAHGGDYDSNTVRHEALRIWNSVLGQEQPKIAKEEPKKNGLFGRMFG